LTTSNSNINASSKNRDFLSRTYFTLCALALFSPCTAMAAGWEIDPVRVELSPHQQTAAITLKNGSDQPTSIQIEAVAWSQTEGKDIYIPTKELLVSPPIVTIAPQAEQIIRVALRRQADASNELTYRINLQELPVKPAPGFTGVQVALRISLPVFIKPQNGEAEPKATWKVSRVSDKQVKVTVQNTGNAHIQVSDFALYAQGMTEAIASESGSSYVLSGQTHEWVLPTSPSEKLTIKHLRLKAYTDADNFDTELVLGKP